jgi:hypothetical protein
MDIILTFIIALLGFAFGMIADQAMRTYSDTRTPKAPSWLDNEFEDMLSDRAKAQEQRVNVTSTTEIISEKI